MEPKQQNKQASKIEIKDNLTGTRGKVGGDNGGGKGGRVFRNNYKGHIYKTKRVWKQGREVGMAGVAWGVVGENTDLNRLEKLYLNKNKIILKYKFKSLWRVLPL